MNYKKILLSFVVLVLAACGGGSSGGGSAAGPTAGNSPGDSAASIHISCDNVAFPSLEWSQCASDPFRYPSAPGPDGATFYENEAEVIPVVFYDQDCVRLSGRVWMPRNGSGPFPGVVIQKGSV